MSGWLVEQLPRPMADNDFMQRFVSIFEDVADSVRGRIDDVEHYFDVGVSPAELLRWMGMWVGVTVDPSLPEDAQRRLVQSAGALLRWRGTARGLRGLLEAFTEAPVEVTDSGGVYASGQVPATSKQITVRMSTTGGLDERQLLDLVLLEVPADSTIQLIVGGHTVAQAGAIGEGDDATAVAHPEPHGEQGFLPPMVGGVPGDNPDGTEAADRPAH